MIRLFPFLLVFITASAFAHETQDHTHPSAVVIPAAVERNFVKITEDGTYRTIKSNGIANHATGQFPGRGNPHAISAQSHNYRVPLAPQKTGRASQQEGVMGVALNGVPFEPGTAECYGRSRGERGPMTSCEWREEAIVNGKGQLGLDQSNAHVQPTGAYHYHGVPHGLLSVLPNKDLVHVGYAADGFKLMVSRSNAYKPSYALKSGTRASGPGGRYTGKYTADFEYRAGVGALDQCNGATVNGEYVYFITEGFPFAPRCLMGQADTSFARKGRGAGQQERRGSSDGHRRPPPHHRR